MRTNIIQSGQQIEKLEDFSSCYIFSQEGFVSSLLARKLLQFPLKVKLVSKRPIESSFDLQQNKRFTSHIIGSIYSKKPDLSDADYIFQILSSSPSEKETSRDLINLAIENSKQQIVKHLLAFVSDDSRKLASAISLNFEKQSLNDYFENSDLPPEAKSKFIELLKNGTWLSTVNLLHLYGPKMKVGNDWELGKFFSALQRGASILVEGQGLNSVYPTHIEDAVSFLVKAMFSSSQKGRILTYGGQEITSLNLAYLFRETVFKNTGFLPEIAFVESKNEPISLVQKASLKNTINESLAEIDYKAKYSLEQGISQTFEWFQNTQVFPQRIQAPAAQATVQKTEVKQAERGPESIKAPIKKSLIKKAPLAVKTRVLHKLAYVVAVVAGLFLFSVLSFISSAGLGVYFLNQARSHIETKELASVISFSLRSRVLFKSSKTQLLIFSRMLPFNFTKAYFEELESYLKLGELASQTAVQAAQAGQTAGQIKEIILTNSDQSFEGGVARAVSDIENIYQNLSQIEMFLKDLQTSEIRIIPDSIKSKLFAKSHTLNQFRGQLDDIRIILKLAPALFGEHGKRTYLILLQNNAELRPTGGFIGSYALVTFEKGKLLDFQIEDVYAADGQLKGHVEPPVEIKKYLGEAGWYLRDSNWDPDFPSSAKQVEWFYEKEMGKKVDGTIAINLYVIQDLMEVLGPINIPDYQETITSDNLFKNAQFHSEIDFFPGSTQKKDFISSLTTNLFLKLESASPLEIIKILASITKSLDNNHILISINDSEAQKTLKQLNWDGSLDRVTCPQDEGENCLKNYFAIREANVGVNKANYFVDRTIAIEQSFEKTSVFSKLSISFFNRSQINTWPGGDYKNYMRIYTNPDSKVKQVLIDGKPVDPRDLTIKAEHEKQLVGLYFEVPVQKEKAVTLHLEQDYKRGSGSLQSFTLIQKQPGTQGDPISIFLRYQDSMIFESSDLPFKVGDKQAVLSQPFNQDLEYLVELSGLEW